MDALLAAVADRTVATIACDNLDFVVVVREAPEAYYLYAVNANCRPLEGPDEAEITLRLPVGSAADMGVDTPVAVPLDRRGDQSVVPLRLDRGEVALIRLARP